MQAYYAPGGAAAVKEVCNGLHAACDERLAALAAELVACGRGEIKGAEAVPRLYRHTGRQLREDKLAGGHKTPMRCMQPPSAAAPYVAKILAPLEAFVHDHTVRRAAVHVAC